VRRLLLAAVLAAACGHPEIALRDEQARSRRYRDAYETQAAELAQLKARLLELEKKRCASP
jgi:hypothetical protein